MWQDHLLPAYEMWQDHLLPAYQEKQKTSRERKKVATKRGADMRNGQSSLPGSDGFVVAGLKFFCSQVLYLFQSSLFFYT